eukprot:TRINITY_DN4693_c0_g1_i2.p3 TRINITY_DN4693_c0_g1~~TRINITY_DN4693_c0_g1_i2.p3  ORF type:complete len:184 (-),score=51.44 TRINITY_DN4693_c0_g1_i2:34-585(-)
MLLGGVMQATGNKPPAMLPARGVFMNQDMERNAKWFGVAIQSPPVEFPCNTIVPMRVLTAASVHAPEVVVPLARELWARYWGKQMHIKTAADVEQACAAAGVPAATAQKLLALAGTEEVKAALKKATDEAVERGAFGAPVMLVTPAGQTEAEFFFGSDRFEQMAFLYGWKWFGPVPTRLRSAL